MLVLYLIRHGETDFNATGRVQGHTESDLSELGLEQARRVEQRLRGVSFIRAYSSPLRRAVQTAEIALGGVTDVELCDGIKEINLGVWEGRTAAALRREYPREVKRWFVEPSKLRIEDGETIRAFRARVVRSMDRIRADHDRGIVAVFAHGGVICTYLTKLLGMKLDDIWRFKIRNASVTRVIFPQDRPRVDLLGDVHHLDGALPVIPGGVFRMFP